MNREEIFNYLEDRFGIDRKEFGGLEFFERSKGRIFCINRGSAEFLDKTKPVSFGLLFGRKHGSFKPSSVIIQIFGDKATKNILVLDREQTKNFIKGADLEIENPDSCAQGYVIVKYTDYALGVGLLKDGKLKNMLQKGKRTNLGSF